MASPNFLMALIFAMWAFVALVVTQVAAQALSILAGMADAPLKLGVPNHDC